MAIECEATPSCRMKTELQQAQCQARDRTACRGAQVPAQVAWPGLLALQRSERPRGSVTLEVSHAFLSTPDAGLKTKLGKRQAGRWLLSQASREE